MGGITIFLMTIILIGFRKKLGDIEIGGDSLGKMGFLTAGVSILWAGGLVTAGFTGSLLKGTNIDGNEVSIFGPESWAVFFSFASGFGAFLLTFGIWWCLEK